MPPRSRTAWASAHGAPAAPWARALARAPNEKFAATAVVYRYAELARDNDVRGLVESNVEFTYRYYSQMAGLRYAAPRRRLHASVDARHVDPLRDAAARQQGILLASAHLGEFDVAGSWLAQVMGLEVVVVVDTVAEATRQSFFDSVRRASGVMLRRRDQTRLGDVEADLRRGRIVLWMFDRAVRGPSVRGELLGRPALFPVAPFALARRAKALLICGTTSTATDGSRILNVSRPIDAGTRNQDLRPAVDAVARILSKQICCCPQQWHVPAQLDQLSITALGVPRAAMNVADEVLISGDAGVDSSVALGASRRAAAG